MSAVEEAIDFVEKMKPVEELDLSLVLSEIAYIVGK